MTVIVTFYRTKTIIEKVEIVGESVEDCIEEFENDNNSQWELFDETIENDSDYEVEEIDESKFSFPE